MTATPDGIVSGNGGLWELVAQLACVVLVLAVALAVRYFGDIERGGER